MEYYFFSSLLYSWPSLIIIIIIFSFGISHDYPKYSEIGKHSNSASKMKESSRAEKTLFLFCGGNSGSYFIVHHSESYADTNFLKKWHGVTNYPWVPMYKVYDRSHHHQRRLYSKTFPNGHLSGRIYSRPQSSL